MLSEEVKVELSTGLTHDHLAMSSTKRHHDHHHNNHYNNNHHHHHNQQQQQHSASLNYPQMQPFGSVLTSSIQDKINLPERQNVDTNTNTNTTDTKGALAISTIAILRRHPMFDSLVLVKKYRACLNGHTLEFPTSAEQPVSDGGDDQIHIVPQIFNNQQSRENDDDNNKDVDCETMATKKAMNQCNRTKLVSVYLDGDDPIYQCQAAAASMRQKSQEAESTTTTTCEIVYVPINGLLDRLDNYDRHGISIDSRVYAFAMGLKTAERFLTSSTEKEIQEAPPL